MKCRGVLQYALCGMQYALCGMQYAHTMRFEFFKKQGLFLFDNCNYHKKNFIKNYMDIIYYDKISDITITII